MGFQIRKSRIWCWQWELGALSLAILSFPYPYFTLPPYLLIYLFFSWTFGTQLSLDFSGGNGRRHNANAGTKAFVRLPSKLRHEPTISILQAHLHRHWNFNLQEFRKVQICHWLLCVTEKLLQRIWPGVMSAEAVTFVLCSQSLKRFPERTKASEEVQAFSVHLYLSEGRGKGIYWAHIWLLCLLKPVPYSSTSTLSGCQTAWCIRRSKGLWKSLHKC